MIYVQQNTAGKLHRKVHFDSMHSVCDGNKTTVAKECASSNAILLGYDVIKNTNDKPQSTYLMIKLRQTAIGYCTSPNFSANNLWLQARDKPVTN